MPASNFPPSEGAHFSTRPAQFEGEVCALDEKSLHAAYQSLESQGPVTRPRLAQAMRAQGLNETDPRLGACLSAWGEDHARALSFAEFKAALALDERHLISRALTNQLVSGHFGSFKQRLSNVFSFAADDQQGEIAQYIPELRRADPDAFALSVCTIDGQHFSLGLREGDEAAKFCIQSTCKPLNYALALELLGEDLVHRYVGREPSGQGFNEITLDRRHRPHNPMINAGAIMTCALIRPTQNVDARFEYIRRVWGSACAGAEPELDHATYESEKATADRNFALAYFMREHKAFPPEADLHETLELYFRCCALKSDVSALSLWAASLANGGVCPLTERRVFQGRTVRHVLSLMLSCGMYDFSGEYAFSVGLPAKSGVSGALYIVVPGVCGIALYSPRLDHHGNPSRGIAFSKRLVETFPWHVYAPVVQSPLG